MGTYIIVVLPIIIAVKNIVDKDKQDKINKIRAVEEAIKYNPYRNIVYPDAR
jgi:hypothetical protein